MALPQLHAQACPAATTGLVLSGGGAKGFAHIGVFQVLDSLQLRPDLIVGSSIGAIMGALYSTGYSGHQIDSIARSLPIGNVIRSYRPVAAGVLAALPAIAVWERGTAGWALQTGSVREGEVNAIMSALMLRGNLLARGDFDRLPIPLRVVATRLSTRTPVVIGRGDLAQAVRASFAIPLIFPPGSIGDTILVDGGISDNIPVSTARSMGAERVIVSLLPTAVGEDALFGDPFKVALQLSDFLFRNDTTQFRAGDVVIRNPTEAANPLDFSQAALDSLVESGRQAARTALAAAGCIATRRGVTPPPPTRAPAMAAAVQVESPRRLELLTLRNALALAEQRPFAEDTLRARLLALGEADDYRAVWLRPAPAGADSAVRFRLLPVYAAREAVALGLAYDNDLGGRMWGGYAYRDLLKAAVEGSASVDLGKYRQEARVGLQRRLPAFRRATPLVAQLRAATEDVRVFVDSAELTPVGTRELEIGAGIRASSRRGVTIGLTAGVRTWEADMPAVGAPWLSLRFSDGGRTISPPTELAADLTTRYQRVHLEAMRHRTMGAWELAGTLRAGWSHRAPLQQQFILGGFGGFPGLRTTERRGEQELLAGVDLSRTAYGPVRALAQLRTGAIGSGGGFLARRAGTEAGEILTGVRLGGELRAGALDIQIARGSNNLGRHVWFVRLGQWF